MWIDLEIPFQWIYLKKIIRVVNQDLLIRMTRQTKPAINLNIQTWRAKQANSRMFLKCNPCEVGHWMCMQPFSYRSVLIKMEWEADNYTKKYHAFVKSDG